MPPCPGCDSITRPRACTPRVKRNNCAVAVNPPPFSMETHCRSSEPYEPPFCVSMISTLPVQTVFMAQVGPIPLKMTCPSCQTDIVTRTDITASTRTHLFAILLCLVGCFFCSCIPYCVDSCMKTDHYCPNCDAYIGSYQN